MQTESRRPTPLSEHVAAVEKAEARYLEAWRTARSAPDEGRARAEDALASARQALRRDANDAIRALSREVRADALVDSGAPDGLSAELGGRVLWYTLDRDLGHPGFLGRDDRGADVRLEAHEIEHWLRVGRVHPD